MRCYIIYKITMIEERPQSTDHDVSGSISLMLVYLKRFLHIALKILEIPYIYGLTCQK